MVFVETWHGTPLKKLAFDLEDIHSADQNHKIMFYKDSRAWDYLISDNIFSSEIFKRAFDLTRDKIIEVGYPRNDILYSKNNVEDINIIKQKLKLPEHKKVALYAPTWRDNIFYEPGKYKFELALNLDSLQEECGDEWVILLRTHYHIADRIDTTKYNGFVYNVSTYDDISELYLVSDVCITDYSSVFFDYANLQRPILYYVYDYELYKNELRGMYLDMERDLPGPLLKTSNEVIGALKNLQKIEEEYEERYNQFYQRYCSIDDGSAAKRVVELVFSGRKSI